MLTANFCQVFGATITQKAEIRVPGCRFHSIFSYWPNKFFSFSRQSFAMSKPICLLLSILIIAFSAYGFQNENEALGRSKALQESEEIDRVKMVLATSTDPLKIVGSYNDLAWEYSFFDYDSALKYTERALQLSNELEDPYWQAVSIEMMAILMEISGQLEEAVKLYFDVIPIRESIDGKGLENTYNNLAIIFKTQGNFEKAYEYFRRSYLIDLKNKNAAGIAGSLINMAITEKNMQRTDSIKIHLWDALHICQKENIRSIEANAMINLGSVYRDEEALDSSYYYFDRAMNLARSNHNKGDMIVANIGLAEIYVKRGQLEIALTYFQDAEDLSNELHSAEYLKRIFADKAEVYTTKKDFEKALFFKDKYFALHDSLTNLEVSAQANELETKYQTERKERQITQLQLAQAEQDLKAKESEDQRIMLIFVAILLSLVLWFGFYRYRKQERMAEILTEKNKTIATALNDREILLQEIHHRVKNNLQVVSSLLSIQGREISDAKALEAVNESKYRVQSMALIHQYLYGEHDLKSIDMQKYITQLSNNLFNAYKLDHDLVALKIEVEPILLDVDTAVPLGIIINELITNSLKYAFPDNSEGILTVKLAEENDRLNLSVCDTGVGKSDTADSNFSFGMKMINAFKNKLKAEIETTSENGFQVLFSIGNYTRL